MQNHRGRRWRVGRSRLAKTALGAVALAGVTAVVGVAPAGAQTSGFVIVANRIGNSVTEYAPGADGDATPAVTVSGNQTQLDLPNNAVQGPGGGLYVSNYDSSSITEYAPGANGNVAPVRVITGNSTELDGPDGLAFDSSGDLWVTNYSNGLITEYAPGADGNVAPITTITTLQNPAAAPRTLAFDSAGDLFVNVVQGRIVEFAPGATGDAAPIATITGSSTGLSEPYSVALDGSDTIYAVNLAANSVTEYPSGSDGNIIPSTVISGADTGLDGPTGDALDPAGDLYVASLGTITEYAPGASGDATPTTTIKGSGTGLDDPVSVAVVSEALLQVVCDPNSVVVDQSSQCTATVTGGGVTPTGAVSFSSTGQGTFDNSSCTLSGSGASASCSVNYTPTAGNEQTIISAGYTGDQANSGADSFIGLPVTTRTSSTSVSCQQTSLGPGDSTTCTATVSDASSAGTASAPTGRVRFTTPFAGDTFGPPSCTLTPNPGTTTSSCGVTFAPASKPQVHVVTARYGGSSVHHASLGRERTTVFPTRG